MQSAETVTGDGLMDALSRQAGELGIEITDIAGNVQAVSEGVERQAASFGALLESADRVSEKNAQVAGAAGSVHCSAAEAASEMSSSQSIIESAVGDIRSLIDAVAAIGEQLTSVQEALASVSAVATTIDRVAKQTNLLALNATIEAARAGDAGRGFAVVAGEVKSLATETGDATAKIDSTLASLTDQVTRLIEQGGQVTALAGAAGEGSAAIGGLMQRVQEAITQITGQTSSIAEDTGDIDARCRSFVETLKETTGQVDRSSETLREARDRINRLSALSERVIALTAQCGEGAVDGPFIDKVQAVATEVAQRLEAALERGEIGEAELFDECYQPVPGSNPEQVTTAFTTLTDRLLPELQEPVLGFHRDVVFCAAVDRNGYLPTHNLKFSEPQGDDPEWNAAHSRNRRIFNDRTGLKAGQNREPFLLQTYRRDMGGGKFAMMKDVSAPVMVRGRHWGGVRLGYKA